MADTKTSALSAITTPALEDLFYGVDDPGGTPASGQMTGVSVFGEMGGGVPGGRLTLTTATPVTTADVTAATTIYYTPYLHDKIRIYDGTTWNQYVFTELTLAVPASTTQMYDIFIYDNAGTLTLEALAWTNDTTRATALVRQNGVLCKTGALTRRYLGSFRTTGVSGQTEHSETKLFLWNYYNRVGKTMLIRDTTSHSYTTAAWRSWNNDSTLRLEFVVGAQEDGHNVLSEVNQDGLAAYTAFALDATNTGDDGSAIRIIGATTIQVSASTAYPAQAAGYHYIQITQYGTASMDYAAAAIWTTILS